MPPKQSESLQYGIRDGQLLHISDVPSGLSCECLCPACSARLVARKGQQVAHHFAHYSGDPCEYARETALHLAAKDILLKRREIVLPAITVHFAHNIGPRVLKSETRYSIDQIYVEHRLSNIIPDVFVEIGGHPLIVEVKVTHGIDDEKHRRIRDLGISAIEVDLSSTPRDLSQPDLEQMIVEGGPHKIWAYSALVDRWRQQKTAMATARSVSMGFGDGTTWGCPLSPKERGEPYRRQASFMWHCIYCEYALYASGDEGVLCLA